MTNKILLTFICIALLLSLPRWFLGEEQSFLFALSQSVAVWLSLFMMLINGTFLQRSYYNFAYICMGGVAIGYLFKILHLTGADEILMISMLSAPLLYSFHFFSKDKKGLLDILKLMTVLSYFTISLLNILHIIPVEYRWISTQFALAMLAVTFIYFIYAYRERLFNPSESDAS